MKVHIGSNVQVRVDPRQNKGLDVAGGLVTRIHEVLTNEDESEKSDERVNVRVFLDTGMDLRFTDIVLLDKEPESDDEDVSRDASGTQQVAWHLPRR